MLLLTKNFFPGGWYEILFPKARLKHSVSSSANDLTALYFAHFGPAETSVIPPAWAGILSPQLVITFMA